jgi:hypothetical protein
MRWFFCAAALLVACSASDPPAAPIDVGTIVDAREEAASDSGALDTGLSGQCADSFGAALTEGFGRIDGVVYALQMPDDQTCAMPNRDHLIVQVLMSGAVYRMVVNTDVKMVAVDHALPAPAFAEGWHAGVALDYPTTLDAHSPAFAATDPSTLVNDVIARFHPGDPVAVYATSGAGRPESAHLVHRNPTVANTDGAIVVAPNSAAPKFLLFAFADQTF